MRRLDRLVGTGKNQGFFFGLLGFGLMLLLSFATYDNAAPNLDSKSGFTAGASLPIRLASIFDIQPEALFVQKGTEGQNVRFFEVSASSPAAAPPSWFT